MSSRWPLQATQMNTQIDAFGLSVTLKTEQIQAIYPFIVLFSFALYQYGIEPLMTKLGLSLRLLQMVTIGGVLAAISFFLCAFVQMRLEQVRL